MRGTENAIGKRLAAAAWPHERLAVGAGLSGRGARLARLGAAAAGRASRRCLRANAGECRSLQESGECPEWCLALSELQALLEAPDGPGAQGADASPDAGTPF